MPGKALAALLTALVLAAPGWGQPAPDKKADKPAEKPAEAAPIDPAVQKLVDQLGDLDFRQRDDAVKKLETLAAKALPALRAAGKHTDAEVRRRAADLLVSIQAATILAPKRVTLKLENKTRQELLDELSKATGYKIECWTFPGGMVGPGGKGEERHGFDWKDVPFWKAMDDVCRSVGMTQQMSYGDDRLRFQSQDRYAPHSSYDGAFKVTAGGFQQTRGIDFSTVGRKNTAARRTDAVTFNFTVHAEPGLPFLHVGEPKLTAAYDDENNSMLPKAGPQADDPDNPLGPRRTNRTYYSGRSMMAPAEVNLARPSAKAAAAKLIKGTVPITVIAEQRTEVVTDKLTAAKGKKMKVGTTTFVVEDVSETPAKQYQVKLNITEDGPAGGAQDYTWMNSLWSRIEVQDEKGAKMQNFGSSMSGSGPNHAQISFTYGPAGGAKPAKLVYQVWTTVSWQVNFEFKDLPLP